MATSITDNMDMGSVTEPVKADVKPPSGEPLTSPAESKADDKDNKDIPNSEPGVGSPQDRPTSAGTATPSSGGDSSQLASGNKEIGNSVKPHEKNNLKWGNSETDSEAQEVTTVVNLLDEDERNEDLTPPPDSPIGSVHPNTSNLQDEIVVGTKVGSDKVDTSPTEDMEREDVAMGDAVDEKSLTGQYPKRKRASTAVYAESVGDGDGDDVGIPALGDEPEYRRSARPPRSSVGESKGIVVGYWRASPADRADDKHGVIGFIDVRDRLRTRLLPTTRDGRPMDPRYPLPAGPGNSWVTFDKVAFEPHLVGHNHHVVKEYIKIRAEAKGNHETPEEKARLDLDAINAAAERVRTNPPPETPYPPPVAYGPVVPAGTVPMSRAEAKRRRLAPPEPPRTPQPTVDQIPGTRPTRILLGTWKSSTEQDPANKHAVYGVIGTNDLFRVKLARETRDGRPLQSDFPNGAGGVWIQWDEVVFDPHLVNLSRAEVKEYCRVRQRQLDVGEVPEQQADNEMRAVYEAKQRVLESAAPGTPMRRDEMTDPTPIALKGSQLANANGRNASSSTPAAGRHPLPGLEYRAANRPSSGPNPAIIQRTNQRTNSIASHEIALLEAAQGRVDLLTASREASLVPATNGTNDTANLIPDNDNNTQGRAASTFLNNMARLTKVWEVQTTALIRAGADDAKVHAGIKYQRKQTGPFQGKLVSQGNLITIDGEDYVEYRVLTKPSFF
ncbi:uncharacterized protein B0T15DRAFT_239392 [Chaetomium strumarium]|uniref:Uncharacterized protein n=1 Tax=Chaetomium strumarium TaxID=1170767 RepID=A0AAJ0GQS6_9PEZI|nr:hypothetical protein B0T15DRAFT_239392 [Chaetomium strumarium]